MLDLHTSQVVFVGYMVLQKQKHKTDVVRQQHVARMQRLLHIAHTRHVVKNVTTRFRSTDSPGSRSHAPVAQVGVFTQAVKPDWTAESEFETE